MKRNRCKKIAAALLCMVMGCTTLGQGFSAAAADATTSEEEVEINFAKALQMSLYFYDANKCGSGITGGNLEWRGDCHTEDAAVPLKPMGEDYKGTNLSQEFIDAHRDILDPDGDGTIDVSGGMHDAGDHVKFCLPGSYAASTLGWGYYEFRDAYVDSGQQWHIEDILHWFNDYYLKCTYFDENGDILAFCYQVGEGNIDHNYWNAPELQNESLLDFARPAYFATVETPASDMCAGVAASLAVNYLNFKDTEPEYAERCLNTAVKMYEFASRRIRKQKTEKPLPAWAMMADSIHPAMIMMNWRGQQFGSMNAPENMTISTTLLPLMKILLAIWVLILIPVI